MNYWKRDTRNTHIDAEIHVCTHRNLIKTKLESKGSVRGRNVLTKHFVSFLLLSTAGHEIPNMTPLEETNFSFESNHQLETASGLGMGTCVSFSSHTGTQSAVDP